MPEKTAEGCSRGDIVSLTQVKTALSLMGATLSLVIVIFPFMLTRLYDRLDSINENTVQIATVQVQISALQRDIDRIMIWVDNNRGVRIQSSSKVADEVCEQGCSPVLYAHIGGPK